MHVRPGRKDRPQRTPRDVRAGPLLHPDKAQSATAKSLLERYLKAPLTLDDPPRAEAERLLKQAASLGAIIAKAKPNELREALRFSYQSLQPIRYERC